MAAKWRQCTRAMMLAPLLLAGCATVGQDFATHKVDRIRIGETTRDEVQSMFGDPWRTGLKDGQRTWTYGKYRWSAFDDSQTTDLVITFDDEGRVASYVYNTTE
ncbi:SmpA/OmlA family protein [Tamilnaduibacter salinus]|uniref:SmpA/OmlA family protein n=2 Tax=Tamilnaduibacter salinus TaxID=1484056 RepID=A0A2U1CXJ5_9GAMM|nr:outer membrane protein assembly factor BamE [Tamilnaduibacter salinus]PVY76836.1 SmpA/OmlA family protein [Tamilnaduibacter salinus]